MFSAKILVSQIMKNTPFGLKGSALFFGTGHTFLASNILFWFRLDILVKPLNWHGTMVICSLIVCQENFTDHSFQTRPG